MTVKTIDYYEVHRAAVNDPSDPHNLFRLAKNPKEVFDYIYTSGPVSIAQIVKAFAHLSHAELSGAVRDLTIKDLVFRKSLLVREDE